MLVSALVLLCFSHFSKEKDDINYQHDLNTQEHAYSAEYNILSDGLCMLFWLDKVSIWIIYIHVGDIRVHTAQLVTLPGSACIQCVHSGASVYVICASLSEGE